MESSPPSNALLAVLNPTVKLLSRTPLGRVLGPLGAIRYTGRRSGKTLLVATGIHPIGDGAYGAFSREPWRLNFRGGADVEVRHRGRRRPARAELVEDPADVCPAFRVALQASGQRILGVSVPPGQLVTEADLEAIGLDLIRFTYRA
jgi:hypothetical protein